MGVVMLFNNEIWILGRATFPHQWGRRAGDKSVGRDKSGPYGYSVRNATIGSKRAARRAG